MVEAKDNITKLGEVKNQPHGAEGLEWFLSPLRGGDMIELVIPEFTCLCPKTGQPDFATITIRYGAAERCVESKSLKLYMWGFRNQGAFHEAVTRQILNDLVNLLNPVWMQVLGDFGVRGGIHERVVAEHAPYEAPSHHLISLG